MDDLFGSSAAPPAAAPAAPAPAPQGDFGRGFGIAGKQLKQTGYGAAALIGDTFGSDGLKQWGLKGYKEAEKEIQAVSKDTDSFTTAIDKGAGSVVDWLQYAAGYLSGQAVETLAAAGAGALVGGAMSGPAAPAGAVGGAVAGAINRTAVQTGVKAAIGKMVDKEAERLVLKGVAADVAAQQAAKSVYRGIGARAGMTLVNATQELGSIYGEAVDEAKGGDVSLARVWLSGIAATAVDSWADSKALGGITDAFKGKTRGASIAAEAFKGGLREGLTEGVQTAIERFGATKDLASAEAFKEYIDSAAIGVLGGTVTGGVKGAVSKLAVPGQPADPNVDPANPDPTGLPKPPSGRGRDPESDAPLLLKDDVWSTLQNAPMMAAMYARGDDAQQKAIIKAVDRANLRGEFEAAFKDRALMERNEKIVSEYPDLISNTVAGIQMFADTMPWPKFKVDFRTTGGTIADENRAIAPPDDDAIPAVQKTEVEPAGDPSVAPTTELPERPGPQDEERNTLITKFNEIGTQIFGMNPGQTQDAKFDWAMNQLVQTHGFSNKDARAILTGSMKPEAVNATTKTDATPNETTETGDISSDPLYPEFVRLTRATSAAEKQSDPKDWTPEQRKAYDDGDWRTFSRLRGYTEEEIKDYGAYMDVANKLIAKYGADIVMGEEIALLEESAERPQNAANTASTKAPSVNLPEDDRGAPPSTRTTREELKDAAANLFDVLTDITGAKQNITGQRYTVKDLPAALTRVMAALIKEGVNSFKEASAQLMQRMRESKDWAPLADKVDQGMLLKAWNEAGGGKPEAKPATKSTQTLPKVEGADPASTLRSQTRAVKGSKGDTLITNQNPINARSFYMTPEEVKENQRAAEELKSGETEEVKGEKAADGDDFAGKAMYPVKPENGEAKKRTESAKPYYRQALSQAKTLLNGRLAYVGKDPKPVRLRSDMLDSMGFDMFKVRLADDSDGRGKKALAKIKSDMNKAVQAFENKKKEDPKPPVLREQQSLALPPVARKADPAPIVKLKGMIEGFIRNMTNASYYEDTIRVLNEQLAKIDARLNEVNEFQTDSGETFRVRSRGDSNPGMWGLQDENAYDRFDSGMVFDKATPKNALLDLRRKIADDLKAAREQSVKGRARLYRLGMDRLGDYIVRRSQGAIRGGVDQELVLAAVRPYLVGTFALREANSRVADDAAETNAALAEANLNLAQEDMFEGERVAIGILSDFKAKKIGKSELQVLETRGIREGDFTFTDLLRAYRAMGISPSQSLYAWTKHFSTRIRLRDYVAQNGGRASAADAYFADMLSAKALMSPEEFARRYGAQEQRQLVLWQEYRSKVLARRHITPRMRDPLKKDPRKVFDGFLFTRISLEEARNPDTIQSTTLRLTYKSLFDNLEEAWFSDLAAALRLRPDLESELFNPEPDFFYSQSLGERIQAIQESGQLSTPTAAVAADPVISPQERAAFKQWVERIKAGVMKQAEVMARSPYFEALRNDPRLEAVRTAEGSPMLASTPEIDPDPGRFSELEGPVVSVKSAREFERMASAWKPRRVAMSADLEANGGREVRLAGYEALYVKVANGELQAVQEFLEFNARFKAYGNGMVDLETGEILSVTDAEELASDALQSVMMNAQMQSALDQYGNEMSAFGARVQGDEKVVRTIEEAAERDAQIGGAANVSMEDLSSEEQIQEEALSEFDMESMEDGSEVETGAAEQGPAAQDQEEKAPKGGRVPRSLIPGMEYRFRRGPAWDVVTAAMVQDIVNQITSTWKNAPNIIVIPNAQHLPPEIRERVLEKLAGDGAKGLYHDGTVYLFSQHLTGEADVEFTLFHEAYGHLGMRALLGEKFDQFLETAYRVNAKVKAEVDALVATGMPKLEAIDEVLSDMAAENRQVGIVKQWVAKVIAGLREIGMNSVADFVSRLTNAEIAMTLSQARDAARNGVSPAMNGAPDDIRFSLKHRPPYEIFSTSGNRTTAYARYNPATDTWAVFHTFESSDIRDNYTGFVSDKYDDVVNFMRQQGKVDYRTRSGMYIDDKIVGDMVRLTGVGKREGKIANWWRNLVIGFQNEYLPVFEMVDYLRGLGRIDDRVDVKTALLLYEGRTGSKLQKFRREYVDPIMRLVKEAGALGATEADVNLYITARHAEERNRAVAAINKNMPDGGSGLMTTVEGIEKYPELNAYKILEDLKASPAGAKLEEIGLKLDQMSEAKINYMVRTGLITKKAALKLQKNWNEEKQRWDGYSHYVNLSGVMTPDGQDTVDQYDDPMAIAGGSKFNAQKGKERRAFGRGAGNLSPDVLGRTIQSFEAQLIRGQKNEVAKKVLALIETNYDPAFAVINKISLRRQLNPETGLVEEVVDEGYMARKDVMVAKVAGIPVTIEFKDTSRGSFAEAIHGYVAPRESNSVMEWIGKANQIFGQMLTTWNPAWVFVNFFRDVQTLYFNSAADGRITKQMARDMLKNLWPALKAASYMAFEGKLNINADPEMVRMFKEMRDSGGMTTFANFKDLESRVRDIQVSMSGKTGVVGKARAFLDLMEKFTLPVEIASRLAAYKVVRDNGWTKEQAATYSVEVTVNFNLRGNQRWVRQLFVFFNPAVQGTEKLYRLAKENPKKMAMYAGMWAGLGMMSTVIARLFGDDDEEDKIPALDKISPYKRATSVVLFPGVPGAALPIPYGWNAPYSFGTFLMDSVMGVQPWTTSIKRAAKASAEAMLPPPIMQGADSKTIEGKIAKTLAPTLGLPVIEYALNENRYGAPIYKGKSPFDDAEVPDAQKYFRGVSPISRAITDGLTSAFGGNKYKAGAIDINPATIDFLIYSYTPGVIAETYKLASTGVRAARGETIKRTPLPIIDRFTAPINQGYEAGAYRRAAEIVETAYKEYSNSRDQERRKEIREEFPRLSAAHATIASAKRDLRDINKRIADLDTKPISSDEKVRRTNELRNREEQIYKRATKRLMEAGPQVSEAILANE
jgi:hypothetical protein